MSRKSFCTFLAIIPILLFARYLIAKWAFSERPIRKTVPIKAVSIIEPKVITIMAPVGEWSEMIPLSNYSEIYNHSFIIWDGPVYSMYDGKVISIDNIWQKLMPGDKVSTPPASWLKYQSATNVPVKIICTLSRR